MKLLSRLGLRTREQRAWAMYDWANSAMITIVVTAVFPIFFSSYAAAGLPADTATFRFSIATTIGLTIIAVLAPILGVIADTRATKKRFLGMFLGLGAAAVASMFFIQQGQWVLAAVLFVLANIGANGSFVFYDSLLPHVANRDELDRVSTAGYALGYVGGGLLLVAALAVIQNPGWIGIPVGDEATASQSSLPARLSFVAVAVWWLLFAIPLFRRVREPAARATATPGNGTIRDAFAQLAATVAALRKYRNAFMMLLAFLVYNDGIGTIIRMATIFGDEIGIDRGALIASIVMVQFVAIPFAFAFGALAGIIGAKRSIFLGLVVYAGISVFGYFLTTATQFFILAFLVAMVQGGTQALSRSLFGSMIPRNKSGEFFGLFAVFEKFAGILGPAVFALAIAMTHSSRNGVFALIVFFVVGAALLLMVDVEEGQRVAREVEEGGGATR
jgi:UMF1 family MFS transporter